MAVRLVMSVKKHRVYLDKRNRPQSSLYNT